MRQQRRAGILRSPFDAVGRQALNWHSVLRHGKSVDVPEPLTEWADDPEGFCRDVLGVKLWQGQIDIMLGVRDNPRVSVAACFASGKTFTAACLVLWWLFTRRPAMIITTAPTSRQVRTLLFREIRKLYKKACRKLPGRLLQTRLDISDDWFAMGFSSDSPNSVAGLHEAENVLFIEDEAAGMDQEVVDGFEGITALEGSRHLKIGNPICDAGPFFDSHMHPEESKRWHKISIDAEDTPNVVAKKIVVHGLVGHDWVEDKRHKWLKRGLLHMWDTRVKGKFHITSREKVIPAAWVIAAQKRWKGAIRTGPQVLGVDVAGGGQDETVLTLLEGRRAYVVDSWQEEDLMKQALDIVHAAKEFKVNRVVIDKTGLGQGLFNRVAELADQGHLPGCEVEGEALQSGAKDSETFNRRNDEVHFDLRWALDPNNPEAIAIDPRDKQLAEELSLRSWRKNERGKVKVDNKDEIKGGSPDRCDSLALCTASSRHTNLRLTVVG